MEVCFATFITPSGGSFNLCFPLSLSPPSTAVGTRDDPRLLLLFVAAESVFLKETNSHNFRFGMEKGNVFP